jgi:hypothetical protein
MVDVNDDDKQCGRNDKTILYSIEQTAFIEPKYLFAMYMQVKSSWELGPHGLLYDREWLITNSGGVPLTAKREPRLCQIKPEIDLVKETLTLRMIGSSSGWLVCKVNSSKEYEIIS